MQKRVKNISIVIFLLLILDVFVPFFSPIKTIAVDTSRTNFINNAYYNGLISNADFININSMSAGEIQNFLASQGSYLAAFSEGGRSAAQIIYDASHGYADASGNKFDVVINGSTGTVSPKVLIVTLQKEQSLITKNYRDDNALNKAMGYACPDSSGCNPNYVGFTKQVENGAWVLRYNYEIAQKSQSWWNAHYSSQYFVGLTRSFSDQSGAYNVTFYNAATAALYRYTPHVFNGNYNFWYRNTNWFGFSDVNAIAPTPYNDLSDITIDSYKSVIRINSNKTADTVVYYGNTVVGFSGQTVWSYDLNPGIGGGQYTFVYRNADGSVLGSKVVTTVRRKIADINGDNKIDLQDLSILSNNWYKASPDNTFANLNPDTDDIVDILDLSIMASNWGK